MNNIHEKGIMAEIKDKLIPTNWWVITGGPSTGKSTLLERLSQRGYQVTQESARQIIDEEIEQGRSLEQIRRDEWGFQERVSIKKEEVEDSLQPSDLIFLDRGLHADTAAYTYIALGDFPRQKRLNPQLYRHPREAVSIVKRSYKGVFLLDRLPYKEDYARTEDEYQAKIVSQKLLFFYRYFGYEPIIIPALPIPERVQFVLDSVKSVDPSTPVLPPTPEELLPPTEYQLPLT